MNEPDPLYSTYIVNCVFNAFSAYTAIMLNILTIHALRKTSSSPKPLKTLLLSLAVSDLGVGLIAQPLYIAEMVNHTDLLYTTFNSAQVIFTIASFLSVVAISVDRFLAVHLHLRYQELVTNDRISVAVISIWTLSVLYGSISWFLSSKQFVYVIMLVILGFCFVITGIVNTRIYCTVRRHTNQIQVQQILVAQNSSMERVATRNRKSAVSTLYVFLVFLLCFLPNYCTAVARTLWIFPPNTWNALSFYALTLMFVNSSLNPVIYCWKMRHIRHAVIDVLRSIYMGQDEGVQMSVVS